MKQGFASTAWMTGKLKSCRARMHDLALSARYERFYAKPPSGGFGICRETLIANFCDTTDKIKKI